MHYLNVHYVRMSLCLNITVQFIIPKQSVDESLSLVCLPFCNSLSHTCVIVLECFLWWINHNDRVCMLCCVLFNSLNFFTKLLSVNEDMSALWRSLHSTAVLKQEVNTNCPQLVKVRWFKKIKTAYAQKVLFKL